MHVLSKNKWAFICITGFAFSFFIYYPGFLSPDSIDQYEQALKHSYYDWHPPIMAYVWHWLNYISRGPQAMLAFQLIMLWSSCYILLTTLRSLTASILLLLLAAAPFIQNFAGYVVKDTQMAFSLLLLFSFIYCGAEKGKYTGAGWILLMLLLLCYGSWLRINALPAIVPLVAYGVKIYAGEKKNTVAVMAAALVLFLILMAQWLFTANIIRPGKDHPENKLYLHDLTAIYAATGKNVYPDFLYQQPNFDTAYIRQHYEPGTFDDIIANTVGVTVLTDESQDSFRVLRRAWENAIEQHPGIYLRHRALGFLYYLRIRSSSRPCCAMYMHSDPNPFGIMYRPGFLSGHVVKMVEAQQNMFYMRPWFWLGISILLCFIVYKKRNRNRFPALTLLLSGILYQLPYFFISPTDTDFRYSYWTVVSCVTAIVLLVDDRNKQRSSAG